MTNKQENHFGMIELEWFKEKPISQGYAKEVSQHIHMTRGGGVYIQCVHMSEKQKIGVTKGERDVFSC